jgi:hypothetical protein
MDDVEFDRRRRLRWSRGIAAYRQSPNEAFVGHPIEELIGELEDAANYNEEAARQDLISAWAASEIDIMIRECASILERDKERRKRTA